MWNLPTGAQLAAQGVDQVLLHERATAAAREAFGKRVFVRAVVEVSNFCRENCHYCGMRRENRALERSRARYEEIAERIINHRPAAVTDINIQAGEDPVAVRQVVIPLLWILRRETRLGLSVCLGTLDPELYAELKAAGASVYILKFEAADSRSYDRYEAPGNLDERLHHIRHLAATGWNVSSGFISGLPEQTDGQLLENLRLAAELPLQGASVSPFVPGEQTPLARAIPGTADKTLNCMAMLRLMKPSWVIPAVSALNLAQPGTGYIAGLRAGANLVTMNLTPQPLRQNYLLYKRERFIMDEERVLRALDQTGLIPSAQSLADYYLQTESSAPLAAAG